MITFATEVMPFRKGWKDYEPGKENDVIKFIQSLSGDGSTFIEGALNTAFGLKPRKGVPCYIIFLTDGLPTVGETDTAKLLQQANRLNQDGRRIFGFGVGWDVDYQFLDKLARENGGYTTSVEPNQDLEVPLAEFYSKIQSPVMSDINISFEGAHVSDVYPRKLPDLFLGGQIILTGRYIGSGAGCVYLSGRINGKLQEFEFPVYFEDSENDYIPRIWANRKVGYLLNEIRLNGEDEELIDEIIDLAKRYGIVTPYTSMLVVDDGEFMNRGMSNAFNSQNSLPSGISFSPYSGAFKQGSTAQRASLDMQSQEVMENIDKSYVDEISTDVRYAGDKTFYLDEDGYWVDADYDVDDMKPVKVEYLSDRYFNLADNNPRLARYLSVGEKVIVVYEKKAYKIVSD